MLSNLGWLQSPVCLDTTVPARRKCLAWEALIHADCLTAWGSTALISLKSTVFTGGLDTACLGEFTLCLWHLVLSTGNPGNCLHRAQILLLGKSTLSWGGLGIACKREEKELPAWEIALSVRWKSTVCQVRAWGLPAWRESTLGTEHYLPVRPLMGLSNQGMLTVPACQAREVKSKRVTVSHTSHTGLCRKHQQEICVKVWYPNFTSKVAALWSFPTCLSFT